MNFLLHINLVYKKTNLGKPLPFEAIDLYLYNEKAFCTVFVTDVKRMHFWLFALAKRLYSMKDQSEYYDVE